jgi:protein-tyrosine-phosphatase
MSPTRLLFLCTGNSARSQMAEGWAKKLAPAGLEVWSAGTRPAGVNPLAVAVMKERGLDISAQRSKSLAARICSQVWSG